MIDRLVHPGDRVIVRDNEDNPYLVGVIKRYETIHNDLFPIVDAGNGIYTCFGIVVKYNQQLAEHLDSLTPKEQWNYLSLNYKRK